MATSEMKIVTQNTMSVVDPGDNDLSELLKQLKDFQVPPVGGECEMKDVVSRWVQVGAIQSHVRQIGR